MSATSSARTRRTTRRDVGVATALAALKRPHAARLRAHHARRGERTFNGMLAERAKPTPVDVFALLGYEPNCAVRTAARKAGVRERELPPPCGRCPQELFHASTEYDVLFGGSAGGGKTKALVMEGIRACMTYPGLRVGAFRRTNPELEESLLAELGEVGFCRDLGARWNASKYNLRFPNGSVMMFRYAESYQDATRRQGGQYQLLLFDERTLTPPEVCQFLESRLRSGKVNVPVLGIRSGTNPGGIGHGAVKTRYIDATGRGERVVTGAHGQQVRFIQSKLTDNPWLNPEYERSLDALDEQRRAAFKDGSWDVFAGQMFSEWRHDRHVVLPFQIPEGWQRYNGVDWGYSNPWAVLWGALDEDGRLWVYDELYATQVGEAEQARRILAAEETSARAAGLRYADDAMFAARGDARPISDIYADEGVHLTPAGKGGRVTGWQRVRSFLAEGPACPHHRAMGWATCPMLHVFASCTELIRTLPVLPHATKGDVEDADTKAEDHGPDALRYLVINIGGGAGFFIDRRDHTAPEGVVVADVLPGGRIAVAPNPDGSRAYTPARGQIGGVVIIDGSR